jgi:putative transposase
MFLPLFSENGEFQSSIHVGTVTFCGIVSENGCSRNCMKGDDMRHPRIRPDYADTFMHVYNRVAGTLGDFPFRDADKEYFIRLLHKLTTFYTVEALAYQLMGNHFHLLLFIPSQPPSNQDAAERYKRYYDGKRTISPESGACTELARKMRDVSEFMKDLEQPFTRWFNRTRPIRRRGHLWAERYKNTILESGLAVWDCWKYIEMNPVRARMVNDPADYRFCSFGAWSGQGKQPFEESLKARALPWLEGLLHVKDLEEVKVELRKEFARTKAEERGQSPEVVEAAIGKAAEKERFTTRIDRRVRYWVDGLVIGSDIFVKNVVSKARGETAVQKRRLVRAIQGASGSLGNSTPPPLCSFKQLRAIV